MKNEIWWTLSIKVGTLFMIWSLHGVGYWNEALGGLQEANWLFLEIACFQSQVMTPLENRTSAS